MLEQTHPFFLSLSLSLPTFPIHEDPLGALNATRQTDEFPIFLHPFLHFSQSSRVRLVFLYLSSSCSLSFLAIILAFSLLVSLPSPTHARNTTNQLPRSLSLATMRRSRLLDIGVHHHPRNTEKNPLLEKISYRYGSLHREKGFAGSNKYSTARETPRNLLGCCFFHGTYV